jgi:hypothetical protein
LVSRPSIRLPVDHDIAAQDLNFQLLQGRAKIRIGQLLFGQAP